MGLRRQGWNGPIELAVNALPEGVGYTPATVPAGTDSAKIFFHAGPTFRETVRQVEVSARVGNRLLARTTVPITLLPSEKWPWKDRQPIPPKISLRLTPPGLARLAPLPDVAVRLGKSQAIQVTLLREGKEGPLALELDGLPEGVTYRVLPVADNPDALQLELRAAAVAEEGPKRVEVRATVGGIAIEKGSLGLTVEDRRPPRPLRPPNLMVEAGQTRILRIDVVREDHEGPIDLELHGLPDGVKCKPATIPADQNTAPLELTVAADALGSAKQVEVWALVGGEKAVKESFLLTVRPLAAPVVELPSEKVTFPTADGVQLVGTWYPGGGGAESPCILLLHQPGGQANRESWQRLARLLQKMGCAVLAFDFRGHGDSTRVEPAFWKSMANRALLIQDLFGTETPNRIRYKSFTPTYYPMLVNDIVAARTFLDQKNDRQECNTSKLIVIGAEEGAALGAMWLYAEWHRFQVTSPDPLLLSQVPEGSQVAGALWLSIRPQIGGRFCRAGEWLKMVGSDRRVPMGFLYGAEDDASSQFARQCLREIKPARVYQHLTADKVIRGTSASGHILLEKVPAADTFVVNYISTILKTVPHPRWSRHFASVRSYYWRFPKTAPIPAKMKGETTLRMMPLERVQSQ